MAANLLNLRGFYILLIISILKSFRYFIATFMACFLYNYTVTRAVLSTNKVIVKYKQRACYAQTVALLRTNCGLISPLCSNFATIT